MMRPMDHQSDAIHQIFNAIKGGARAPLFQLSTGGGKTVVCGVVGQIGEIAQKPVLMIAHRNNLVEQASETFKKMGVDHGIINPNAPKIPDRLINIGMVQTVSRRLDYIPPQMMVVIDEAHHCAGENQWKRVSEIGKYVLGVTATPSRADGLGLGVKSGGIFDYLIKGPSMDDLIKLGRLVPMRWYGPAKVYDWSQIGGAGNDFTQGEITRSLEKSKIYGDAVNLWAKFARGLRTITFCHSKRFAGDVCDSFNSKGVPSVVITGDDTATIQRAKIQALTDGTILNLIAIDVISEGTDIPCVFAGIGMRPTKSLNLWYQQAGRIMRSAKNKEFGIWIDMVGNANYHGYPGEHEWSLDYEQSINVSTKAVNNGIIKIRTCEKCLRLCEHNPCEHCGHTPTGRIIQQVTEAEYMELKRGDRERKDVAARANNIAYLTNILRKQRQNGYKIQWAMFVYKSRIGKFPSKSEISEAEKNI
jgi:superfamily II DNA or RNA helicase